MSELEKAHKEFLESAKRLRDTMEYAQNVIKNKIDFLKEKENICRTDGCTQRATETFDDESVCAKHFDLKFNDAEICKICYGTGVYQTPNGEDDYAWEECTCGAKRHDKSEEEFISRCTR